MCRFEPNSITDNVPSESVIITDLHPIFYNNARYHANKFKNLPGVHYLETSAKSVLPAIENRYFLWDIQFDTVGSYVANGITLQSRHPRSFLTPLHQHEYINPDLFINELQNDHDPAFKTELLYDEIESL